MVGGGHPGRAGRAVPDPTADRRRGGRGRARRATVDRTDGVAEAAAPRGERCPRHRARRGATRAADDGEAAAGPAGGMTAPGRLPCQPTPDSATLVDVSTKPEDNTIYLPVRVSGWARCR